MREEDRDYAVAFSVPADAPGILYDLWPSGQRHPQAGSQQGGRGQREVTAARKSSSFLKTPSFPTRTCTSLGEIDFTGMLVERFAGYHRQSYGGCKVGNGRRAHRRVRRRPPNATAAPRPVPHQGQDHRDDPSERDAVLLRHRLFLRRLPHAGRQLPDRHAPRQRVQAERHPPALRDRPPRAGHRRAA